MYLKYPLIHISKYNALRFLIFSFLYFPSIANVIALSILYAKHPDQHNHQQFNVKATLKEDIPIHVKLGVT